MKITNGSEVPRVDLPRHAGVQGANSSSAPVSEAEATDKLELSEATRLPGAGTAESGFRADKVEEIRAAIAEGRFEVKIAEVADRMIHESASLLEKVLLDRAAKPEGPVDRARADFLGTPDAPRRSGER